MVGAGSARPAARKFPLAERGYRLVGLVYLSVVQGYQSAVRTYRLAVGSSAAEWVYP
jgi:hypothetical protein